MGVIFRRFFLRGGTTTVVVVIGEDNGDWDVTWAEGCWAHVREASTVLPDLVDCRASCSLCFTSGDATRKAVVVNGTRDTKEHNEKTETKGLRVIFALSWRFLL